MKLVLKKGVGAGGWWQVLKKLKEKVTYIHMDIDSHLLNLVRVWPNFCKVKNGILEAVGNWYGVKGSYIIPGGMNSLELRLKMC